MTALAVAMNVSDGTTSAILAAETAFLTNATRGMEPVAALEDKVLGWPQALRELQSAVERARRAKPVSVPNAA